MAHTISFRHALDGIIYVFRTQPNFRIHSIVGFCAIFAGWLFRITRTEWLILLFTVFIVFATEMVNTAIESMTDLITTEHRQQAKIAKDVSAGMVLISAIGASIVGLVIFMPYVISKHP